MAAHDEIIFHDWVYNDNNEGTWVMVDLSSYLDQYPGLVRIIAEVTEIDTDGSEYVYCKVREYDSNYATSGFGNTITQYNNSIKGEMFCFTDSAGKIEYFIEYGWWEAKKVKVKLTLKCSLC